MTSGWLVSKQQFINLFLDTVLRLKVVSQLHDNTASPGGAPRITLTVAQSHTSVAAEFRSPPKNTTQLYVR